MTINAAVSTRVGVVGLGEIGGGIAQSLARTGMLRAVFDKRPDAANGLENVPSPCTSLAELAAQCDVIIVAVVDAQQVLDVLSGAGGLLADKKDVLDIILVSTVSIDDFRSLRTIVQQAGAELIDCGVVGGLRAAQNGLTCLVGAEQSGLSRVRPALEGFAGKVVPIGGPGAGMTAKIIFNSIFHGCLRSGVEGARLAKAAGIDVGRLSEVMNENIVALGGPLRLAMLDETAVSDLEEADKRRRAAGIIAKDLRAALKLGGDHGVEMQLVSYVLSNVEDMFGLLNAGVADA